MLRGHSAALHDRYYYFSAPIAFLRLLPALCLLRTDIGAGCRRTLLLLLGCEDRVQDRRVRAAEQILLRHAVARRRCRRRRHTLWVSLPDDGHRGREHGLEWQHDEVARGVEPLGEGTVNFYRGGGLATLGGHSNGHVVDWYVLGCVCAYRDLEEGRETSLLARLLCFTAVEGFHVLHVRYSSAWGEAGDVYLAPVRRRGLVYDALLDKRDPVRQHGVEQCVSGDGGGRVHLCALEAELVVPAKARGRERKRPVAEGQPSVSKGVVLPELERVEVVWYRVV